MSYEETDPPPLRDIIAPGAPIIVSGDRVGIACFVINKDGVYLVTCGHAFSEGEVKTELTASDGTVIAYLEKNYLEDKVPLDAAICKMTDDGIALAKKHHQVTKLPIHFAKRISQTPLN